MDERKMNDEIEIDIQRLIGAVLNKAWLIALVAVLAAAVSFVYTYFLVSPLYQSSVMFYVNNSTIDLSNASLSVSAGDISASRGLVDTYIVILDTRETLNDVIDYAGVERTYEEVKGMIAAEAVNETEIFKVVVTSTDPAEAEALANSVAYNLPKRINTIIDGTSTEIVDSAVFPTTPISPSYTKNTMLGFLVGLVLSVACVVLVDLMDVTIRTEEDIAQSCKHPVLASVPDMQIHSKGGSYYGYGKNGKRTSGRKGLIGSDISFVAAESYKLLRTKLQFSFADEQNCRVIGMSSALSGEGKSLSSANLAYSIAQLGKRVLLVECDMRRPSLHEKLPIKREPGLSDFLAGQTGTDSLIQFCGIPEEERAFHVIASGNIPPNPMELLSSAKMEKTLAALRENYDYILLDLPPVGEVSDALAAAKFTDGMLLVVRQNYCDRVALNAAVRQFEFVDSKVLGVVFNCTEEDRKGYSNKYYKRYYKRASKKYARAYGKAEK